MSLGPTLMSPELFGRTFHASEPYRRPQTYILHPCDPLRPPSKVYNLPAIIYDHPATLSDPPTISNVLCDTLCDAIYHMLLTSSSTCDALYDMLVTDMPSHDPRTSSWALRCAPASKLVRLYSSLHIPLVLRSSFRPSHRTVRRLFTIVCHTSRHPLRRFPRPPTFPTTSDLLVLGAPPLPAFLFVVAHIVQPSPHSHCISL